MEMNTTKMNWVLCSTKFEDIIHIVLSGLNAIQVETNYQETLVKNEKSILQLCQSNTEANHK